MSIKPKDHSGPTAFVNARLLDPATGLDAPGGLLTLGEAIAAVGPDVTAKAAGAGVQVVDCKGLCLAPGLVDLRVQIREPGEEHKGTLETAGKAGDWDGIGAAAPRLDGLMQDVQAYVDRC